MATSKTLAPTNVTINIPAMADQPDMSVVSNCIDKEADAINTLNSQITNAFGKSRILSYGNVSSISVDLGYTPTTSHYGTILMFNGNQSVMAIINIGSTISVTTISGNATITASASGSTLTISSNNTLWGCTTIIVGEYGS